MLEIEKALDSKGSNMIYNWISAHDSLTVDIYHSYVDLGYYGYQPNQGLSAITFSREVMEQYTRQEIIEQDLYLNKYWFSYEDLVASGFKIYIGDNNSKD